jgi:hypothetical protein
LSRNIDLQLVLFPISPGHDLDNNHYVLGHFQTLAPQRSLTQSPQAWHPALTGTCHCSAFASCAFYIALLQGDCSIRLHQEYPLVGCCSSPEVVGDPDQTGLGLTNSEEGEDVSEILVERLVS